MSQENTFDVAMENIIADSMKSAQRITKNTAIDLAKYTMHVCERNGDEAGARAVAIVIADLEKYINP